MTKHVMKLMAPYSNKMECTVCGYEHYASIKGHSNGRFIRGSWQCLQGCKLPSKEEPQAYNGWKQVRIDASEMHLASQ